MRHALLSMIGLLLAFSCQAQEEASLVLESRITGNQEQPKVLYLVPWQAGAGAELLNLPFESQSDSLFEPIRRDDFLRQLAFRRQWQQAEADAADTQ